MGPEKRKNWKKSKTRRTGPGKRKRGTMNKLKKNNKIK